MSGDGTSVKVGFVTDPGNSKHPGITMSGDSDLRDSGHPHSVRSNHPKES